MFAEMTKMAKKLEVVETIARKRLIPPEGLSQLDRKVWTMMVNACSADHFIESDIPLMVSYVKTFIQWERAAREMEEQPLVIYADNGRVAKHPIVDVHKSLAGTLSNLAMRLRLAPSTRHQSNHATVATHDKPELVASDNNIESLLYHR